MRAFLCVLAALLLGAAPRVSAEEKVIRLTAEKFRFSPGVLELKQGEPVVLEITTADRKHGFSVPDLGIDENVEPGKVTRVRIVPAKAGTFAFHCDVFCGVGHEEMAGEIVVKP